MCSLVILRRPGHAWPVLIGANRDELVERPWRPPGRHWPDRPETVAGLDELAGGSWFGVNDHGVVAAILNRVGSLGPAQDKRSRGELVLEALEHAEATAAAAALAELDPAAYRPFNLVIADAEAAFWLRHAETPGRFAWRDRAGQARIFDVQQAPQLVSSSAAAAAILCQPIPAGLAMVTAHDLNDPSAPRIRHFRPRFEAAPPPDPASNDWQSWIELLAARQGATTAPEDAMTIVTERGFGTVCSQLAALPAFGPPRCLFAAGRPGEAPFLPVPL